MSPVLVIAVNTFREAIRNRVFASLILFAIGLLLVTMAVSAASMHEEVRLMKDVGLFLVSTFASLICIFVGSSLVYKEIERKTIYTLLPKPIHRWQFLLGKYLGILATMGVQVAVMGLALMGQFHLVDAPVEPVMLQAIWLIYVEVIVIGAVALLFSSFSTPFLSGLLTAGILIIGRFVDRMLSLKLKAGPGQSQEALDSAAEMVRAIAHVLPDLSLYNVTPYVVYDHTLPAGYLLNATGAGLLYAAMSLGLAALLFSRRDFI